MPAYATKEEVLLAARRATWDAESPLFGALCLQEFSRAAWRACIEAARLGAGPDGKPMIDTEKWAAARFASGVVDPTTRAPLFTIDEVLGFTHRTAVWAEVARLADHIQELSEVGPEAIRFRGAAADAG